MSSSRPIQSDGRLHGVAVAIVREDGRLLMVRRSRHVTSPLTVCFPGGAMELGETEEQAVAREMIEELGLRVRPVRRVWRHEFAEKPVTLYGWLAELESPEELARLRPDEQEIAEVLWLTPEEGCGHTDGLVTNRDFIARMCEGRVDFTTESTEDTEEFKEKRT